MKTQYKYLISILALCSLPIGLRLFKERKMDKMDHHPVEIEQDVQKHLSTKNLEVIYQNHKLKIEQNKKIKQDISHLKKIADEYMVITDRLDYRRNQIMHGKAIKDGEVLLSPDEQEELAQIQQQFTIHQEKLMDSINLLKK